MGPRERLGHSGRWTSAAPVSCIGGARVKGELAPRRVPMRAAAKGMLWEMLEHSSPSAAVGSHACQARHACNLGCLPDSSGGGDNGRMSQRRA
ncbi:hypothetical protein KL86PLE_40683 [uncultured Pleomorphomonas sp.]|uniref:Uncharacterized protein n=1 Tax=uncultured Pleomorphomonas sp. TaxID=442121 RepID=A0A212LHA3_9HYPH|nr:hypothetical protein KL86PLE_40683 [uncultured Pleomorphomonas sp.]